MKHTSTIAAILLSLIRPIRPCDIGLSWSLVALAQPSFWACSFNQFSAWKIKCNKNNVKGWKTVSLLKVKSAALLQKRLKRTVVTFYTITRHIHQMQTDINCWKLGCDFSLGIAALIYCGTWSKRRQTKTATTKTATTKTATYQNGNNFYTNTKLINYIYSLNHT